MMIRAEPVGKTRAMLGEGPCWHEDLKALLWVDIMGSSLHQYDPQDGSESSCKVPGNPGCVVGCSNHSLLAAVNNSLYLLDGFSGEREVFAGVEPNPRLRFNDGKCDSLGRLWVGTMDRDEKKPIGSLYKISGTTAPVPALPGITVSNGMGWSPDDREMYYIDSPRRCIWVLDFDRERGVISNRRTSG